MVTLLLDLGLSPLAYYVLSALGCPTFTALLAASGVAAARIGYVAIRTRRLNTIAGFTLGLYAVTFLLSLIAGDERLLLVKDPVLSGLVGVLFLASCTTRRPAMYHLAQRLRTSKDPLAYRRTTIIWGCGLVAEATLRIVLVYRLPVEVMAGLSVPIELAVVAGILGYEALRRSRIAAMAAG